ncbi:disulfide bond formation protein DsbB [Succinimonas sp.]|uniref:disulfide bond formation protein DsbB n=1 Tax=Succinimonas sp. TaxID=1936151 RepID=UPI0038703C94
MKESLRRFLITLWFPHSRLFWAFLFLGFIFYEACGLYFQYVLHLNPCIECVYERACFMFFGVAALLGVTAPRFFIVRILAVIIWLMSSIKGILISWEHRGYELTKDDPFAETCGFFAEFPSWFKLDEWLPSVFAPTGICGDASWNFAGLTMVQWIIIIFICNAVTAGLWVLLSCLPYRIYRKILSGKEGEKAGAE